MSSLAEKLSSSSFRSTSSTSLAASMEAMRPAEKLNAKGETMTMAALQKVTMRVVKCTGQGTSIKFDGPNRTPCEADFSHVKTDILAFNLKEDHLDPEAGFYYPYNVTLKANKTNKIADLKLSLNGQVFDLSTTEGKIQLVMAKSVAALPMQGLLSMRYKSPLGGEWFVEDHPVDLDFQEPKDVACCAIM